MPGIPRFVETKIRRFLEFFPVVALIGPRQAGKTTVAKQIVPDWYYVDMEKPTDFDRVSYDVDFFFTEHPHHVIIDEAQEYPNLFRSLRGVVDANRQKKGRFILTGSSSPDLLNHLSETLAGRIGIIELGPLKAAEFYHKPLSPFYSLFESSLDRSHLPTGTAPLTLDEMLHFWLRGGYPEPLLTGDSTYFSLWMENYRSTYLNRDLATHFPRLDRLTYRRFLQMLSQLSGTLLNKSEIARAIEVSEKSVRDYLEIAEGTFLFRLVTSFDNSLEKSLSRLPKGYIRDSGLLHHLLNIQTLEQLYGHPIVGKSFEGFVVDEIEKGLHATQVTNWRSHYWRTKNQAEVDLVIEPLGGVEERRDQGRVL